MMAGKASRSTSYHEKTKINISSPNKKKMCVCVILDTSNNNKRIRVCNITARLPESHACFDSWREITSPGVRTVGARYTLNGDSRAAANLTVGNSSDNIISSVKS